jgi:hypothetical protein
MLTLNHWMESPLHRILKSGTLWVRVNGGNSDDEQAVDLLATIGSPHRWGLSSCTRSFTSLTGPAMDRSKFIAILTGAISLILGIAYLTVVQLLDMRGEMIPAPF